MGAYGPQEPKPFGFVPLPTHVDRRRPAGHDRFMRELLSGSITGELVAQTPIHVGSGGIELTNDSRIPLVKAHFRTAGKVAIPGSSLKGAIRSIVEAITYSCVRVQSRRAREALPQDFRPCEAKAKEAKDKEAELCIACRLFGAMGYQGQVRLADAVLVSGRVGTILTPSLYPPRTDARLYYEKGQVRGRKFYFHGQVAKGNVPIEVCEVQSRFRLSLEFLNLEQGELGILLTALGCGSAPFDLKLGGAKPICTGSMKVQLRSVDIVSGRLRATQFESSASAQNLNQCLEAAKGFTAGTSLEKLMEIWTKDPTRVCPSRVY
ncbi:MAG TPA: RAMP superfamily CRISPR-associated protein [Terriglobia bacterium]|nr:RAMP superfamily CRISPR-associated protein [Terriglobia bacterium]